jgi:hypothetical protein
VQPSCAATAASGPATIESIGGCVPEPRGYSRVRIRGTREQQPAIPDGIGQSTTHHGGATDARALCSTDRDTVRRAPEHSRCTFYTWRTTVVVNNSRHRAGCLRDVLKGSHHGGSERLTPLMQIGPIVDKQTVRRHFDGYEEEEYPDRSGSDLYRAMRDYPRTGSGD